MESVVFVVVGRSSGRIEFGFGFILRALQVAVAFACGYFWSFRAQNSMNNWVLWPPDDWLLLRPA